MVITLRSNGKYFKDIYEEQKVLSFINFQKGTPFNSDIKYIENF
jgi:hypothetical protein